MRILLLIFLPTLMLTGCCINFSTKLRNETSRDVLLTRTWPSQTAEREQTETVLIYAKSNARFYGDGKSWIISDGKTRYVFSDVSPIATMPSRFTSSTRLTTHWFPCLRITRYVRLAPDMTIHADRVIGYTESEPPQFPLYPTKSESEK